MVKLLGDLCKPSFTRNKLNKKSKEVFKKGKLDLHRHKRLKETLNMLVKCGAISVGYEQEGKVVYRLNYLKIASLFAFLEPFLEA